MAALAAAPALAAGPPGWVVFGLAVVVTAVGAAMVAGQSRPREEARPTTGTRTTTCETCDRRPWSVRVHAQGTDIGGTTGSTLGAPPLVRTSPITVAEGVALASATYALLGRRVQANLATAYERCVSFIEARPPAGFLGSRSFYGASRDNNRFDVDSYGPSPNFIA
jgi:hypothetical protein